MDMLTPIERDLERRIAELDAEAAAASLGECPCCGAPAALQERATTQYPGGRALSEWRAGCGVGDGCVWTHWRGDKEWTLKTWNVRPERSPWSTL